MREIPDSLRSKLDAAARVFASHGFDATRIEDLADATGVPKATLYYYFTGKEEILAHLLGTMLEVIRDEVKEASSGTGPARQRLEQVVRAQLDVMAAHPDSCTALISELGRAGRMPETSAAINEAFHAPVRALLVDGAADGTLHAVANPEAAASVIFGAVTFAGLHEIVATGVLDADRLAGEVLSLLLDGLAGDVTDAASPVNRRSRRSSPRRR
jgi:AcrR family transcriptional regulator